MVALPCRVKCWIVWFTPIREAALLSSPIRRAEASIYGNCDYVLLLVASVILDAMGIMGWPAGAYVLPENRAGTL